MADGPIVGYEAAGLKDFEDFVAKWDGRIRSQLIKLGARGDSLEDLKQEVYLRIVRTGHIEKYDSTRARFPSHIFAVSRSVVVNSWRTAKRRPLDLSYSLVETMGDEEEMRGVRVLELLLADQEDPDARGDATQKLARLESVLRTGYLWSRKTQVTALKCFGAGCENNLWQVAVWLFVEGHTVGALAAQLGVSHGSVSNWKSRVAHAAKSEMVHMAAV